MASFQQYNISPWLTPVRLCSNVNVSGTYNNGAQNNGVGATLTVAASSLTVDSVVAAVGDRILLQGQTSANQNGVYVVLSIGTTVVLQRAADQQSIEQFKTGQYVTVGAGTALGGTAFVLVESLPAILGINNQSWIDASSAGNITLPTIANHLAVFTGTAGQMGEDVATAINGGNIQAGLSGTAGTLGSFPAAATSGELLLAAVTNSAGNFNTTISNASSVGQSQVVSIPDSGSATANFILSKSSSATQHITSGNLQVDAGNLIAGLATGGQIGTLQLFPTTTTTGSLRLISAANGGNFNVDITNASFGQATVITIADPGAATAKPLISGAAVVSGNFPQFSGTAGLVVDSALAVNKVLFSGIASPDQSPDLVSFDVTVGQAELAAGGSVTLVTSSGSKQYKIRQLFLNSGGTNFSGGGGDRLGQVTDGTTVYSVVPAANMQALTNTVWGGTAIPFPASAAIFTSTVAGANLSFKYSGGATDYTAGSLRISGIVERVA